MGKKESNWVSAEDLLTRLENDPEWVAAEAKEEKERQDSIEKNKRDSEPLLAELAKIGFHVKHISELKSKKMDYQEAIPILLEWLPKIPNRCVQMNILSCLNAKWAFPIAWKPLVKAFKEMIDIDLSLRWDVGRALYTMSQESVFDDVYSIAMNRSYGKDRGMVVEALSKMKNPIVPGALVSLLDDESVHLFTIDAVAKLKAETARPQLEKLKSHSNSTVRQYAKRALAKLDRHAEKIKLGKV